MSSIIVLDSSDEDEAPPKKKVALPHINSSTTLSIVSTQNKVPTGSKNHNNSNLSRKTTFVKNNTLISNILLGPDETTTMAKPRSSTLPKINAAFTIKAAPKALNTPSPLRKPTTPTSAATFTADTSNIHQNLHKLQPKLQQIQPKSQQQQKSPLQQLQQKAQQLQLKKPQQLQIQKPQQQQIQKPMQMQVQKPRQLQIQRPYQLQTEKPQQLNFRKGPEPQVQKSHQLQVQKPQEPHVQKSPQPQVQKPQQLQLQKSHQLQVQTPLHPKVQKPQQIQLQKHQQSQKLQQIQLQKQQQQLQHQIQQQQQTVQHEPQKQSQQLQSKQQEIMQQQKKKQQQQNFQQQVIQIQQDIQKQQQMTQHQTPQQHQMQHHHELLELQMKQLQRQKEHQQQMQQLHQQLQQQFQEHQQLEPRQLHEQPKPNQRKRKISTPPVPVSLTAAPTPAQACSMLFPSMMMNSSANIMPMIKSVHSMASSAMPPLQLLTTSAAPPPPPITTTTTAPFNYFYQPPIATRPSSPAMQPNSNIDNFKIHLPLKQPNYMTSSPAATTTTTFTSTASELRSIKRIKPITLLKNNDVAWIQRHQNQPRHHIIPTSSSNFSLHDNEFLKSSASSSALPASSSTAPKQGYGSGMTVSRPGQQRSSTTTTPAISSITTPTPKRSLTPKATPVKKSVTPTMRAQMLKEYPDKSATPTVRVLAPKTIATSRLTTPTLGAEALKDLPVFDLTNSPEKPKICTKAFKQASPASTVISPRVVNTLKENGTSPHSTSTVESSTETSIAAAAQPRSPFVPDFEQLINVCRTADPSDDMDLLIKENLTKHYYSVHPDFVHSHGFRMQLQSTVERIKKDPKLVYYNLKDIVEELTMRCVNSAQDVPPEPVDTSEIPNEVTSTGNKDTDEKIKKLNDELCIARKQIKMLEETEVDWDDDDSSYLQVERLQKRACQIFEEICELTGESKSALSQVHKAIKFTGTTYPQFNRILTGYINQTDEFPDYFDVLRLLERCNNMYSLGLAQFEMKHIAQDAFIKVGKLLQTRRRTDLYETAALYTANSKDPATADPVLLAKLSENQKHKKKISDVLEKYARKQDINAEEIRLKKAATIAANSANADGVKTVQIVENGKNNKADAVVAKILKEYKDYIIDDVDVEEDDENEEEEEEEEEDDDDDVEIVDDVVDSISITEITDDDDDDSDGDDSDGDDSDADDKDDAVDGDGDENNKSDDLKESSVRKLDKLETKNTGNCNITTTFTATKTTTATTSNAAKSTAAKTAIPIIVNKDNFTAKSSNRNGEVLIENSQTAQPKNSNNNNNNNIKTNLFSLVHGDRPKSNLLSLRLANTASAAGTATSTSTATTTSTSINYKPLQQQLQQKQLVINGKLTNVKRVTFVPPPPTSQCISAPATTFKISSVASLNNSICKNGGHINKTLLSPAKPLKPRVFPDIVISDDDS